MSLLEQIKEKIIELDIKPTLLPRLVGVGKKKWERALAGALNLSDDEIVSVDMALTELIALRDYIAPADLPQTVHAIKTLLEQFRAGTLIEAAAAAEDKAESFREAELLEGVSTRTTDHGKVIKENPRVIFEHITAADDERTIKRKERTDWEIAGLLNRRPGPGKINGCALHDTPDCTPCRLLEKSLRTVVPGSSPKIAAPQGPTPLDRSLLKEEALKKQRIDRKRKSPKSIANEDRSNVAIEDEKDRIEKKRKHDLMKYSLRRDHGYDARQLAKLLDLPDFQITTRTRNMWLLSTDIDLIVMQMQIVRKERKKFPRTLKDLISTLPWVNVEKFPLAVVRDYQRYAARNSRTRGQEYEWVDFENEIIQRAWELRLLRPKTKGVPIVLNMSSAAASDNDERDREHDHALEEQSGGFGDTTVTAGYNERTGQLRPMNSFDRGPTHWDPRGGKSADEGGDESSEEGDGTAET